MEKDVPAENILPERQATFTYENAIYTRKLTDALGLTVRTALLSCQAYHARRALLYYQALFPETRILVTPTVTQGIRREDWFERPKTIDLVLQEVEHCGSQFHEILKNIPNRPFRSLKTCFSRNIREREGNLWQKHTNLNSPFLFQQKY